MASAERFGLYPCSFVHAGGTLNLAQMQGFNISTGAQRTRIWASGAVDPKAHVLANASPVINFQTRDLATYWGTVSPTVGLAQSNSSTYRLQERSDLSGVFETGSTNETYTVEAGWLCPVSVSASQDDANGAIVESMHFPLYNGTTEPIVHNTAVDISGASAPAFTSEFWLGPVYHNGAEIPGIINTRVDFGINFAPRRTSGHVYPKKGAIVGRGPMLSFTTLKVDVTATINQFLRATAGTMAFYYWKGADAGSRVAVATTVHCKISAATGAWGDDSMSVQDNDDATSTISILPTGTIAVSVASAIP